MGPRDDELLSDPPEGPGYAPLHGYRAGSRARRLLWLVVALALLVAVGAGVWWARRTDERLRRSSAPPAAHYTASPGTRPREMVWTSGRARLGLSRFEPGVQVIRLPDRTLRLAEGCDHAQVVVEVEGDTSRVHVLLGDIIEDPSSASNRAPAPRATGSPRPAPRATAPRP